MAEDATQRLGRNICMGISARAKAQHLLALFIGGARAADEHPYIVEQNLPAVPCREWQHAWHTGIQNRQRTALIAPAFQIVQGTATHGNPLDGIELRPMLPEHVVMRNK